MQRIVKSIATTSIVLIAIVLTFELLTDDEIHKQAFFLWGSISIVLAAIGFRVARYNPDEEWIKVRIKQALILVFYVPLMMVIPLEVKQGGLSAIFGAVLGNLVYFVVWHFYFYLSERPKKHA